MRVSDRPQRAPCPYCSADTLVAWQDGLFEAVHVDPLELTPLGELQAHLANRRTFNHWGGQGGGLTTRDARHITRWPAGQRTHIRPEHRCGAAPPDHVPPPLPPDAHAQPPF